MNKLTSSKTQVPLPYYSAPYPKPDNVYDAPESIGSILAGDKIETSLYRFTMLRNENCVVLGKKNLVKKDIKRAQKLIREKYRANLLVDELPAAERVFYQIQKANRDYYYEKGFLVGQKDGDEYYWYNHVSFTVKYHKVESGNRVVGFEAEPRSVKHSYTGGYSESSVTTCNQNSNIDNSEREPIRLSDAGTVEMIYTYSVKWDEDETEWASRWDLYLRYIPGSDVHWFTLGNSILIAVFLTIMVGLIILRTVYSDIARYNSYIQLEESKEEIQEESGWKLVHGDVFRPPTRFPMLFSIIIGTGYQLFWMTLICMLFACLGFLSPVSRGSLLTAALFIFIFLGTIAGYSAARLYKFFKGVNWKTMTIYTALFFPGLIFSITFVINLFFWFQGSTRAIPFLSLLSLLIMWFGVSTPLVFVGAFLGFRRDPIEVTARTNQVPRQIMPIPWYNGGMASIILAGLLPFGGLFLELYFVMSSVWLYQVFYVFGLFFVIFLLTLITSAEVAIVMCYFQLINEDWHWWWRSVFTGGSIALYLFGYSFYYASTLQITKLTTILVYFGNMFMISTLVFLVTGSIGFFSCFWFVKKIYGSIKVD